MVPTQPSTPLQRAIVAWILVMALILGGLASLVAAFRLTSGQEGLRNGLLIRGGVALVFGVAIGLVLRRLKD